MKPKYNEEPLVIPKPQPLTKTIAKSKPKSSKPRRTRKGLDYSGLSQSQLSKP